MSRYWWHRIPFATTKVVWIAATSEDYVKVAHCFALRSLPVRSILSSTVTANIVEGHDLLYTSVAIKRSLFQAVFAVALEIRSQNKAAPVRSGKSGIQKFEKYHHQIDTLP